MLDNYGIRTDLALEATERFTEENVEVRGVEVHEDYNEEKDIRTTVVKITTENGARTMGRPQGSYITIEMCIRDSHQAGGRPVRFIPGTGWNLYAARRR